MRNLCWVIGGILCFLCGFDIVSLLGGLSGIWVYMCMFACVPMCVWEHMPMHVVVTVKVRNKYWKEKGKCVLIKSMA